MATPELEEIELTISAIEALKQANAIHKKDRLRKGGTYINYRKSMRWAATKCHKLPNKVVDQICQYIDKHFIITSDDLFKFMRDPKTLPTRPRRRYANYAN